MNTIIGIICLLFLLVCLGYGIIATARCYVQVMDALINLIFMDTQEKQILKIFITFLCGIVVLAAQALLIGLVLFVTWDCVIATHWLEGYQIGFYLCYLCGFTLSLITNFITILCAE